MRKGFIYNLDLCVRCHACSAGCMLENNMDLKVREIYQANPEVILSAPLINIPMACNHCEDPACLNGCPSGVFTRDKTTNAILADEKKCFGCNYCTWNCPYDAPKIHNGRKIILKCDLCNSLLKDGGHPACSSSCPTGALGFGEIPEMIDYSLNQWFPDKKLNPSIRFTSKHSRHVLRVIPEDLFTGEIPESKEINRIHGAEWSLAGFSFLSALSVAICFSNLLITRSSGEYWPLAIAVLAGLFSLFHLSIKLRAWRAMNNILRSPLSREIAAYLTYILLSAAGLISGSEALMIASTVTGFVLLIAIDLVYTFADRRPVLLFHSGNTFLSGLLIASFLAGMTASFLFIAGVKMISGVYFIISDRNNYSFSGIRFLRLAFLMLAGVSMVSRLIVPEDIILPLFLAGELIDRIMFYSDFEPLNIKTVITDYTKSYSNEKKGD